jgi:hypothetical protein
MASLLAMAPVSAKKSALEFKANGKLTNYPEEPDPASVVVGGRWDVKIMDGAVEFKFYYRELNLDPEVELSPEGSVDHFRGYVTELYGYYMGEGIVEIWCKLTVDKKMWFLDEYEDPPPWLPEHAPVDWIPGFMVRNTKITITPDGIEIDYEDDGTNLYGSTLSYHD